VGEGGPAGCATRVLSLSANGTGMDSDAAYARVVADLKTDLPVGNDPRTIEFWAFIKTTDWIGEKNELYEYGTTTKQGTVGLDFGTNPVAGMPANRATLNPFTNGGFNEDSTKDLGITSDHDQWVHIAMTWDQTSFKTYVNGVLGINTSGTGGITSLATGASPITIGCNFQNHNCFNGYLAEFRVWKVAHTAGEISASYKKTLLGNETGLVGYLKFDDAPGATTAADSVTTPGHEAHPGALQANMPQQVPTFVAPHVPVPVSCP
jgi:hypothetical protein